MKHFFVEKFAAERGALTVEHRDLDGWDAPDAVGCRGTRPLKTGAEAGLPSGSSLNSADQRDSVPPARGEQPHGGVLGSSSAVLGAVGCQTGLAAPEPTDAVMALMDRIRITIN
ncbi:MAG: hypothetical protein JOY92_15625 [Verrucomicrobia bacterium]|nr:hypothetical protein [Verrucomicrobiota bacterium]